MSTLYEKLVARHTVATLSDEEVLLYVTFHIMNEVTRARRRSRGWRRRGARSGGRRRTWASSTT